MRNSCGTYKPRDSAHWNSTSRATDKEIIVVGCVDLNRTQRGFLEQIASQVAVWIAAPESAAALFDAFGGLQSQAVGRFRARHSQQSVYWSATRRQIKPNWPALACPNWVIATMRATSLWEFRTQSLVTELKHQLGQSGQIARYGPGTPLTQSEPALLLRLLGEYIDTNSFVALAALVRHPAMPNMFCRLWRRPAP